MKDYSELSNAELKILLLEWENEYEANKNKVKECLEKMEFLDNLYSKVSKIYKNRTKGKI